MTLINVHKSSLCESSFYMWSRELSLSVGATVWSIQYLRLSISSLKTGIIASHWHKDSQRIVRWTLMQQTVESSIVWVFGATASQCEGFYSLTSATRQCPHPPIWIHLYYSRLQHSTIHWVLIRFLWSCRTCERSYILSWSSSLIFWKIVWNSYCSDSEVLATVRRGQSIFQVYGMGSPACCDVESH